MLFFDNIIVIEVVWLRLSNVMNRIKRVYRTFGKRTIVKIR